jgi:hypothetical protein
MEEKARSAPQDLKDYEQLIESKNNSLVEEEIGDDVFLSLGQAGDKKRSWLRLEGDQNVELNDAEEAKQSKQSEEIEEVEEVEEIEEIEDSEPGRIEDGQQEGVSAGASTNTAPASTPAESSMVSKATTPRESRRNATRSARAARPQYSDMTLWSNIKAGNAHCFEDSSCSSDRDIGNDGGHSNMDDGSDFE